jgi:tetratricopeptide (TPR) repeat protein
MPSILVRPRLLLTAVAIALLASAQGQSVTMLLVRGDSLMNAEKPQRALELFEQAVRKESTPKTLLSRARAYAALERWERFVADVDKALNLDSTSAEAHYQRAVYCERVKDSEKAIYHAGKSVAFTHDGRSSARAHRLRGEVFAEAKRYSEAIPDLELGLAEGREDLPSMRTLARCYDAVGQHAEALRILERLCELDPVDMGNWTNRAYELLMLERYEDALGPIERALSVDKDEPVVLSHRAYAYAKLGRNDEAWADVERSLRNFPSNPHALRTRAILRLRKGERAKACEDLGLARALGDIPEVDLLLKENCSNPSGKR